MRFGATARSSLSMFVTKEYGVFAAVADSYLRGSPVAVCGTAGPGVTHLFNGLMDARKEGATIIAIAGDVETKLMDTAALEELNPYKFFDTACLYVGRVVTLNRHGLFSRPRF